MTLPDHDVRTYHPRGIFHGVFAAPPCNEYSFVKSEKLTRDLKGADEVLNACLRIVAEAELHGGPLKFWALENPIGHIVSRLGKPVFTFQPWEFGDPWTKRTGIWGRFNAPVKVHSSWDTVVKNPALYIRPGRGKPNMVWLHKSAQSSIESFRQFGPAENDAAFRAITPQGFAEAFFKANP